MIETNVICRCLFLITFLQSAPYIQLTSHGQNNAYIQDDSNIQYFLDNIPASIRTDLKESEDETRIPSTGDTVLDDLSYIKFKPNVLDFKEKQLGIPYQDTVTIFNRHSNRTIQLNSISGNTRHFHSSFFEEKIILPHGNTTFKVVFLGRDEIAVDSFLYIQTSEGTIKYHVKGRSISSLYRLRPLVEAKIPINASFAPFIYMYNPCSEPMQVMEVYSSGGEFQLELPSGEAEGSRETWEIAAYQTKPVIRLRFNTLAEKNHTAYIRFRVNNSAEILVVAVEVQVGGSAGLHWAGNTEIVNFGMGGSSQPPMHYLITVKNSAKKPIKVVNIISTPMSKALKINLKPAMIPAEMDVPVAVGSLVYDWKMGLDLREFKGQLTIKGVWASGSTQKISVPWVAQVFQGGLEVINASAAHYCSPHHHQPRHFSAINRFKLPLAISNVTISSNAAALFSISNFVPKILKPGQTDNIFSLSLSRNKKNDNLSVKLESSIFIYSNISTTTVPLLSYDGKLKKIIPGEKEGDKGTMNFGMVGSGTKNEAIFALENENPVNVELHGWGVNMPGAVLELTGCQNGPKKLFDKGYRNVSACSVTGNQSIKPGYLAIFKIKVKTPTVEDDAIVGDVFVKTTYERLTVPVHMRVAYGRMSVKKVTFVDCFPGSICSQQVKVHSTFAKSMEVTGISPVNRDNRHVKYLPHEETASIINKGNNSVGSIVVDPSTNCEPKCYLGLSLNSSVGIQWLTTMSLPSHTRDFDLSLMNARYSLYLNSSGGTGNSGGNGGGPWGNVTILLDTTEVRGYKFHVNIIPSWPSLLASGGVSRNKSLLIFPLTQVGNTTYKKFRLHNPSSSPLYIHLTMDWSYPQGMRLYESLPDKFKIECKDCASTASEEFRLDSNEEDDESRGFSQDGSSTVAPAPNTRLLILKPAEARIVRLSYTPSSAALSSGLLYIRNNMTILEVLSLSGRGAHAQFKFGNRKPGSLTPLLFELSEKHLKDCEERSRRNIELPIITVKRTFAARNTGELSINVYGFYINGLSCEGYGFKVLNCAAFSLSPNATKKIDIAFTPDFSLSRIERQLVITTSLDGNVSSLSDGAVKLTLLTTIPVHMLHACEQVLVRPTWESSLQWSSALLLFILMCVLAVAILEADRILSITLVELSRGPPLHAPFDFRLLTSSPSASQQFFSNYGVSPPPMDRSSLLSTVLQDEKKKDAEVPASNDWFSSANTKRTSKYKLDETEVDEEQKFKIQHIGKEHLLEEDDIAAVNANVLVATRKKSGKRTNVSGIGNFDAGSCCSESSQEVNKFVVNSSVGNKTSPAPNRKMKFIETSFSKEGYKSVLADAKDAKDTKDTKDAKDANIETEAQTTFKKGQKSNNKKKQLLSGSSQKVGTLYSEEETSSTTTESSAQEDIVTTAVTAITSMASTNNAAGVTNKFKEGCERAKEKNEKPQRKTLSKKGKPVASASPVGSTDYKDNYEGDCDDDEYDKEKLGNANRWKTSVTRSNGKNHYYQGVAMNCTPEANNKATNVAKSAPRKDKSAQKRRALEKSRPKHQHQQPIPSNVNGLMQHHHLNHHQQQQQQQLKIEEAKLRAATPPITTATSTATAPPPPLSCWGENRARFSDVVARNQDQLLLPSSFLGACGKSNNDQTHNLQSTDVLISYGDERKKRANEDNAKEEEAQVQQQIGILLNRSAEKELNFPFGRDVLTKQAKDRHVNSFFVNSFVEPQFEPELVPYDDLPETDEPLMELESTADEQQPFCSLWQSNSGSLSNEAAVATVSSSFQMEAPKTTTEPIRNLPDPMKDNWLTIETNWEPLYTRGAVGEERSGVWGVNTGGVWAAAPWGSPTSPISSVRPSTSLLEPDERSGFDPFRSLKTIWTPSSSESWRKKQDD